MARSKEQERLAGRDRRLGVAQAADVTTRSAKVHPIHHRYHKHAFVAREAVSAIVTVVPQLLILKSRDTC